ncbi:MAG: rRNA maturation RNase YbeY [Candidatus Colwellbacteria bacterium]|nr:rRNA maturation RNase YbeY [Candidatus Colwellbacteria bacterium]
MKISRSLEAKKLRELAKDVLRFLGNKGAALDVNFVDAKIMKSLNWKFRGKKFSTNVLAFETPKDFPRLPGSKFPRHLGEIYLDLAYIKRHHESKEYMLIHGVLHLMGFDHKKKGDRMRMEKLEKKILEWQKTKFWV